MRIVYCILGTFNAGGMERVLANKANYLVRRGYDITVVTTDQQGRQPYFPLDPAIRRIDLGINYTHSEGQSLPMKLGAYIWKKYHHKRKLRQLLREIKPDVTVSMFDLEASFLYRIKDGSKKVLEIHFSRYKRLQYQRQGIWKWIDRYRSDLDGRIASKYDKFVVLTEEDRQYWGALPHIAVIPNASSFRADQPATLEQKKVIAVGRLDFQKRFEDLLTAWQQVSHVAPAWQLTIFGHGPDKTSLMDQIDRLGIRDSVHLREPVPHIQQEMLGSSMLVLTSRYEGLPMVLLEGQACGLPLVSYACKCGPRDLIQDGVNGFLIPEGDTDTLAQRILMLMSDGQKRKQMGAEGFSRAEQYSEEVVMNKWMDLFREWKGSRS